MPFLNALARRPPVRPLLLAALLAAGGAAAAQPAPEPACYRHSYDDAYLEAHPQMALRDIRVLVARDAETGQRVLRIWALSSDQGEARLARMENARFEEWLSCDPADPRACIVELDGAGGLAILRADGEALEFVTDRLVVELADYEEIDGIDLAIGAALTRYRLERVADGQCPG